MMFNDQSAALLVPFNEFCAALGVPLTTGKRVLATRPETLPPAVTIGCRRYVFRADAEAWLQALKARARAA
jgi:hypothetical protein